MIYKPNYEAEPSVIEGRKAWFMGKNPDGKAVFKINDGFLLLKNGKTEIGNFIDEEGRFIPETQEIETEKKDEVIPEEQALETKKKPKKGKDKNGNSD